MFEISGNDIPRLSDADLRDLILRLAKAEFHAQGLPLSSITAGGNQDAADGGLDVRIETPNAITSPDFVPRRITGFQVKKPDMPASAIRDEMRPKDVLRSVIKELTDASGSYVIVSAQGSVADKSLSDRRKAMRDALHDQPNATQLHTDFYDRDRIATWINKYPGVAAWVRSKTGRSSSGWSNIGKWTESDNEPTKPYLFDDKTCLIDESSHAREQLTIIDGIARLRALLATPRRSIRLIGLSGLGKTRLVEALFEKGIGNDPLDPSLAIYTDYSEEPTPIAREMARNLIASGQRAILVIDNCNPTTHSDLANLCTSASSKLSLLTVEYDVRDDEPERTEVFRLQSASPELLKKWLEQNYPDISQIDRDKIAEFSDGNFRVARAIAETLGKGETLGRLKSHELFERIFRQRNETDRQLLYAAQDLSLLYSIDGEDISTGGELARVACIRNISASQLFGDLFEMRRRGIVQSRGRFRAILPQAIANPLAADALERIPPADFDRFCLTLTPRMLKSVSHRLGYLHDSTVAQSIVSRWLDKNGPLGDLFHTRESGFQIITNIAPVAPETVLKRIEEQIESPNGHFIYASNSSNRYQWIRLIKTLGYDAAMFERAIKLLALFLAVEPEGNNNNNSVRATFGEMFHIHLSGTRATPEQRRAVIKHFALSKDPALLRCASVGLEELLESYYFSSMGSFDFGARSRDWGWYPKINRDRWDWFNSAITLAIELIPFLTDVHTILAHKVRNLWHIGACHETIRRAAITLNEQQSWIEGWIALRATLRYDGKKMPEAVRLDLKQLIKLLRPSDLLSQARAIILNRTFGSLDFTDGEENDENTIKSLENADKIAQDLGRDLAKNYTVRAQFMAELLVDARAPRAYECGQGLAEGAESLNLIWDEMVTCYSAANPGTRTPVVIGGFLYKANLLDKNFAVSALEAAIDNRDLAPNLPYFQARVGIDHEGIARLRRAISKGVVASHDFHRIANGVIAHSPPEPLAALLKDISSMPNGVDIALNILHMSFFCSKSDGKEPNTHLITVGRNLLPRCDFRMDGSLSDHDAQIVISICLKGDDAQDAAKQVCANIRTALQRVMLHNLHGTIGALFKSQPLITLDALLLPVPARNPQMFFKADFAENESLADIDPTILQQWADQDPHSRYPLIGECISMFGKRNAEDENEISSLFLTMLNLAPDKKLFIGDIWERLHPRSWSGSLVNILLLRMEQIKKLAEQNKPLRDWITELTPNLEERIERERKTERMSEESFE